MPRNVGQLLIRGFVFVRCWGKIGVKGGSIELCIDSLQACDSVVKEDEAEIVLGLNELSTTR